jgi:predicted ArsR family transcriptional regulator
VLTLTDEARQRYGQRTGGFLRLLLEEIVAVEGRGKLHELLGRVQQRMAAGLRREVGTDGSPAERLRRLAERMSDEGIVVEANGVNGDIALTIFTCPYPELAGKHREICEMERQTVSELVGGSVELDQCMLDGHLCCEFKAAS